MDWNQITEEQLAAIETYLAAHAPQEIISRGFQYAQQNRVRPDRLTDLKSHDLHGLCEGTSTYRLTICTDQPKQSVCDCPYQGVCKHQVAMYLILSKPFERIATVYNRLMHLRRTFQQPRTEVPHHPAARFPQGAAGRTPAAQPLEQGTLPLAAEPAPADASSPNAASRLMPEGTTDQWQQWLDRWYQSRTIRQHVWPVSMLDQKLVQEAEQEIRLWPAPYPDRFRLYLACYLTLRPYQGLAADRLEYSEATEHFEVETRRNLAGQVLGSMSDRHIGNDRAWTESFQQQLADVLVQPALRRRMDWIEMMLMLFRLQWQQPEDRKVLYEALTAWIEKPTAPVAVEYAIAIQKAWHWLALLNDDPARIPKEQFGEVRYFGFSDWVRLFADWWLPEGRWDGIVRFCPVAVEALAKSSSSPRAGAQSPVFGSSGTYRSLHKLTNLLAAMPELYADASWKADLLYSLGPAGQTHYRRLLEMEPNLHTRSLDAQFARIQEGIHDPSTPALKSGEAVHPVLALASLHRAVEDAIDLRKRDGYRLAVRRLKSLRALYKRLKQTGRWLTYLQLIRKKYSKLRSLMEEMERGGLTE